ncbi:alpha/beta fold hydrolase [Deinococcus roseus]|uniref:Alpha/beta hydrolase n=1 Tax=Deinococcus roseus TaxID=392414 RepID=A0ABQ2D215_9DEIO|nr:alpha/beta hydrolase [Deinococcus roseus]GGJ38749.1 alpha/beta hydrolase [Deinococcus roseus]
MNTPRTLTLKQGPLQYLDTGQGEAILFLHGAMLSARLWRKVIPQLQGQYRCIAPTLPIGGHALPMHPEADLSPHGVVQIIVDFMDHLGLKVVTLVGNDTGGALVQFLMNRIPDRISRVVLTNCDCFEVFPPKVFEYLVHACKVPFFVDMMAMNLRIPALRNLPFMLGGMSVRPVEIMEEYLQPLFDQKGVRRDLGKLFVGIQKKHTLEAAQKLPHFKKPVLVAWGKKDRMFAPRLAERLTGALPNSQLIWLQDSKTLVPEDQPAELANLIELFLQGKPLHQGSVPSGRIENRQSQA